MNEKREREREGRIHGEIEKRKGRTRESTALFSKSKASRVISSAILNPYIPGMLSRDQLKRVGGNKTDDEDASQRKRAKRREREKIKMRRKIYLKKRKQ